MRLCSKQAAEQWEKVLGNSQWRENSGISELWVTKRQSGTVKLGWAAEGLDEIPPFGAKMEASVQQSDLGFLFLPRVLELGV